MPLPFQNEIQSTLHKTNTLIVLARGLGILETLTNTLSHSQPSTSTIQLILNIPRELITHLNTHPHPIRHITSDYSIADRRSIYSTGGLLSITPSILVHDLLHKTLPAHLISTIQIFSADSIRPQSPLHFSLNLLHIQATSSITTAYSENAPTLSKSFHYVEKLMRILHASHLSLWPRFHTSVKTSLSHTPDLIDLSVPLPPSLKSLRNSLHDSANAVLNDLNSCVLLDMTLLQSSGTLIPYFDTAAARQIDRPTHRVRNLLADLTAIRNLLRAIFDLNAVLFYQNLLSIRHTARSANTWLIRPEAQRAFRAARARVWQTARNNSVRSVESPSPKWSVLFQVLSEIRADVRTAGAEADVARVLVAVKDPRVADEIRSVLTCGGKNYLKKLFQQSFPSVAERADLRAVQTTLTQLADRRGDSDAEADLRAGRDVSAARRTGGGRRGAQRGARLGTEMGKDAHERREELSECFGELQREGVDGDGVEIVVWARQWLDLQGRGHSVLDEYRPSFIVLYDADVALVRETEVYKALHPGRPVRMYILMHDDCVEEELFRSAISREKAAFKSLIRERAQMSVQAEEGAEDAKISKSLLRMGAGDQMGRDSRLARVLKPGSVIVDTRELRSSLPMLLYEGGIHIQPVTLEVADFVLSKDIGIERKSIPDLHGSFGSGRLFNQAEALCRHYRHACLLIELGVGNALSLSATSGGVQTELLATAIVSKMVLLVQQFPQLRLLWAKGANDAAELFVNLKVNESEPDVEVAAGLGVDSKQGADVEFNAGPRALLRNLPGIDGTNLNRVMKKVRNVSTLIGMSIEEMTEVLGSAGKARMLFDFVNEQPSEALAAL